MYFFSKCLLVQFQSPLLSCSVHNSLHQWSKLIADQVAQLSSVPDYFQYPKLRLSDDCPHCCKSGATRQI